MAAMQPERIKLAFGPHTGPQTSTHPSRHLQILSEMTQNSDSFTLLLLKRSGERSTVKHAVSCCVQSMLLHSSLLTSAAQKIH